MRSVNDACGPVHLAPAEVCDGEFLAEVSHGVAYAIYAVCGLLCLVAAGLVIVLG